MTNGLSGKDTPNMDYRDMMPFSDLAKGITGTGDPFTTDTAKLISDLIKEGKLTGVPSSMFRNIPQISQLTDER